VVAGACSRPECSPSVHPGWEATPRPEYPPFPRAAVGGGHIILRSGHSLAYLAEPERGHGFLVAPGHSHGPFHVGTQPSLSVPRTPGEKGVFDDPVIHRRLRSSRRSWIIFSTSRPVNRFRMATLAWLIR